MDDPQEGTELLVVATETPVDPDPEPEELAPPPDTVLGLAHETGETAAEVRNLEGDVDDLRSQLAALRAELPALARQEAHALIEEIADEVQEEMQEESGEAPPPARKTRFWEHLLGGP